MIPTHSSFYNLPFNTYFSSETRMYKDGSQASGSFENDKLNGEGWFITPDYTTYQGRFVKGRLCQGKITFANGIITELTSKNDKLQGLGTITSLNGIVSTVLFYKEKIYSQSILTSIAEKIQHLQINLLILPPMRQCVVIPNLEDMQILHYMQFFLSQCESQ